MNVSQKETLKKCRRILGFAAMGVVPSPVMAKGALQKLEREIPDELHIHLAGARQVLIDLSMGKELPSTKKAHGAMDEVKIVKSHLEQMAQGHHDVDTETDGVDDHPTESPKG